jgi:hypothetical protein
MNDGEKTLFRATSQIDQLYNLLQLYEVTIPPEDLVAHEDLHDRQVEYRKEVEIAQAYRDSKVLCIVFLSFYKRL